MARLPARACSESWCPDLAVDGGSKCERHRQQRQREYDQQRREERPFYWSAAWRRLRALVLRNEPLCRLCYAKEPRVLAIATEVDHIKPVKQRPDLALEFDNLQPLCKPCHLQKTREEEAAQR